MQLRLPLGWQPQVTIPHFTQATFKINETFQKKKKFNEGKKKDEKKQLQDLSSFPCFLIILQDFS